MNKIKFGEIRINQIAKDHINDCIARNHVTMGPKVKLLEELWADKFGYKAVRAVSSGTAACTAACLALYDFGARPGDEVIVPALSFIATANAVRAAGFTPVFCDVNKDMSIDERQIDSLINIRTRAIMPVALMGRPPKMDVIRKLADDHNLKVILDNCEGHGCKYQGKYMSQWADMVVYSCYAAHILFAGEMGFVGCNTDHLGSLIGSVRSHGRTEGTLAFYHNRFGLNLKPTDLHASIGLGSFTEFDDILADRKRNLRFLRTSLDKYKSCLWFCEEEDGDYNSPHAFSMVVKHKFSYDYEPTVEGMQKALDEAGIEWKRNFGAMPDHPTFRYLGVQGSYPTATYIGNHGIHIGCHQFLGQEDLDRIVSTISIYIESTKNA